MISHSLAFAISDRMYRKRLKPFLESHKTRGVKPSNFATLDELAVTGKNLVRETHIYNPTRKSVGTLKLHRNADRKGILAILTETTPSTIMLTYANMLAQFARSERKIQKRAENLRLPQDVTTILHWYGSNLKEIQTIGMNRFFAAERNNMLKLYEKSRKNQATPPHQISMSEAYMLETLSRLFPGIVPRPKNIFHNEHYGILRMDNFTNWRAARQKPDLREAIEVYAAAIKFLEDYPHNFSKQKPSEPWHADWNTLVKNWEPPTLLLPDWEGLKEKLQEKGVYVSEDLKQKYEGGAKRLISKTPVLTDVFLNREGRVLFDFYVKKAHPAVLFPLLFLEFGIQGEGQRAYIGEFIDQHKKKNRRNFIGNIELYHTVQEVTTAMYLKELTGDKLYERPDLLQQVLAYVQGDMPLKFCA